jgi:tetratricopeptide (TPR) repeat protein
MAELKKAIEQQEGLFSEAHFQVGLLLARQGDVNQSLDEYQTAISQSGGVYPEAYYNMGLAHVRIRNTAAAVTAYRKAIEQRGGVYPEAHQDLGRALYSMGDLAAANEEYSVAVRQRNPAHAAAKAAAGGNGGVEEDLKQSRRSQWVAEELESGLRQAPATADHSNSGDSPGGTEPLAADSGPDSRRVPGKKLRPTRDMKAE